MSERAKWIHRLLISLALILAVVLVYANRHALIDLYHILKELDWQWLLLLPVLQLVSQFFIAQTYRSIFRIYGYTVPIRRMLPMVWALSFVSQILPSGGLSSVSYFVYGMRGLVPASRVTMAQLARYVLTYLSYALVLITAFIFLILEHNVTKRSITLLIWLVVASAAIFLVATVLSANERIIKRLIDWVARIADRVSRIFRRHKKGPGEAVTRGLLEFYGDYKQLAADRRKLLPALGLSAIGVIFDNLIVIASFWIVGADLNPGTILIAFTLAQVIGALSFIPGDIGVHEAGMVAALTASGVPLSAAIAGTVIYRIFNKILYLPVGFVSYSRILKPAAITDLPGVPKSKQF